MTWICPTCEMSWPEKPFVDGTIGCPECGSIPAPPQGDPGDETEVTA